MNRAWFAMSSDGKSDTILNVLLASESPVATGGFICSLFPCRATPCDGHHKGLPHKDPRVKIFYPQVDGWVGGVRIYATARLK